MRETKKMNFNEKNFNEQTKKMNFKQMDDNSLDKVR